jgi:uncharacterized membrane protein SpoIIM required for sporulation
VKQQDFAARYAADWDELERYLEQPDARAQDSGDFPRRYRQVCQHLALAKQRRYSTHLIARLNQLALRGHQQLYQHSVRSARERNVWLRFIALDFPRALRANAALIWISLALFGLPGIALGLGCYFNEDLIYSVMDPVEVRHFDAMYEPGRRKIGRERGSDTDLMMFGFYIKHNIGISFQSFAGGILFGVGTVFFMLFNGVMIGATAGHITAQGYLSTFYPFVIGHGAFELTAIVFSGAAGLKLGLALIDPGAHSRSVALRMAGRDAATIMYGVIGMLTIAAFLEAFWSSSATVAVPVKYAVGAALWLAVLSYCIFAGRSRAT